MSTSTMQQMQQNVCISNLVGCQAINITRNVKTIPEDIIGILDGEESDIGFFGMRKNYIGCHCSRKDIYKVMIDWQLKLIGFAGVK